MKRFWKKSAALMLALCTVMTMCACGAGPDKTLAFDDYAAEMLRFLFENDYVSRELYFKDPEAAGLGDVKPTFGIAYLSKEKQREYLKKLRRLIVQLDAYDRQTLTDTQRKTYDLIAMTLETQSPVENSYTENPIAPNFGWQAQMPALLAELSFDDKAEVENYLTLLCDMPRYVEELLQAQKERAEAGCAMSREQTELVKEECRTFISAGEKNVLVQSFDERMEKMPNLTREEKAAYKQRNREIVNQYCVPAYETLKQGLEDICEENEGKNGGLTYQRNGKAGYASLLKQYTLSDKEPEEIKKELDEAENKAITDVQMLYITDAQAYDRMLKLDLTPKNPEADVAALAEKSKADFPALSQAVPYKVTDLQDSLTDVIQNPAFYIVPPLDKSAENSIYLNRKTLGEDGLVTLAHEGFPGHLYQTNYLRQKGESYVTQVLMPSGYTEGWGLYVEQYSLKYLTGDTNAAAMYKASRELSMILSCKADYGVNYEGWDKEKLEEELGAYGLDDEAVEELYQLLIASPGEYFKYYYTAHTIQTLYDKAKDELGILFKDKEFHKAILDAMPTEKGLNEAVEQYITQSRGQKKAETRLQPAA